MPLRVAMLSPIAWRTPPRDYGPWERVVSLLSEGLVARGVDLTLFATADSITSGRLRAVCRHGYEEDPEIDAKVWECLHISEVFERADEFDLIHNNFDFLPLTYSALIDTPMLTTIHGFSSAKILPVYRKYQGYGCYVAISEADRDPELEYLATIHHGVDLREFTFRPQAAGEHLLFFARIHPDKGADEAIAIARRVGLPLILAGVVQDHEHFRRDVEPQLDDQIRYVGSVGPRERDELLGGALALLHPIRFNEPFGLSVIESMACGTPVIAYLRGSMPELIRDGYNGFLVHDLEGAVAAVGRIDSIERRDCRAFVEQEFSVERMVDRYLDAYALALDEWPARRERWRSRRPSVRRVGEQGT